MVWITSQFLIHFLDYFISVDYNDIFFKMFPKKSIWWMIWLQRVCWSAIQFMILFLMFNIDLFFNQFSVIELFLNYWLIASIIFLLFEYFETHIYILNYQYIFEVKKVKSQSLKVWSYQLCQYKLLRIPTSFSIF